MQRFGTETRYAPTQPTATPIDGREASSLAFDDRQGVERYVPAISEVIHPGRLALPRVEQRHRWYYLPHVAATCLAAGTAAILHETPSGRDDPAAEPRSAPPSVGIAPPKVEPVRLVGVSPTEAMRLNAEAPTVAVGPAAKPFRGGVETGAGARALTCLAQAVYYEAAVEAVEGQRAVAQVVLNRVRNPAFPATVCGVVFQGAERSTGCQFSFTCDGSLRRRPSATGWARAVSVATSALNGAVFAPVGNATHYHADFVLPYWASSLDRLTRIGAHIFYRWSGFWGRPSAFRQAYRGVEPDTTRFLAAWSGEAPSALQPPATEVGAIIDDALESDLVVGRPVEAARLGPATSALRSELNTPSRLRELGSSGVLAADREAGLLRMDADSGVRAGRDDVEPRATVRQAARTPSRALKTPRDRAGASEVSGRL